MIRGFCFGDARSAPFVARCISDMGAEDARIMTFGAA